MNNAVTNKLMLPAVGLIIAGVLNLATGFYFIVSPLIQIFTGAFNRTFASQAEEIGYYVGFFAPFVIGILSLLIAPVIIYGAIQMMRGRSYRLAKISAILAVIPLTSCCFIIGIPLGIWALIVLNQPEVKTFFQNPNSPIGFEPPPPPAF